MTFKLLFQQLQSQIRELNLAGLVSNWQLTWNGRQQAPINVQSTLWTIDCQMGLKYDWPASALGRKCFAQNNVFNDSSDEGIKKKMIKADCNWTKIKFLDIWNRQHRVSLFCCVLSFILFLLFTFDRFSWHFLFLLHYFDLFIVMVFFSYFFYLTFNFAFSYHHW